MTTRTVLQTLFARHNYVVTVRNLVCWKKSGSVARKDPQNLNVWPIQRGMVGVDESLVACFPVLLHYTSVIALFSISGFWILASSSRRTSLKYIDMIKSESEGSSSTSATLTLVFSSSEELQTRLVLLPRVEEEGIGAVVESFVCIEDGNCSDKEVQKIKGAVVDSILVDDKQRVELKDKDFAEILAAMREAVPPIHLKLSIDEDDIEEEEEEEENRDTSAEETPAEQQPHKDEEQQQPEEPVFEEEKKVDPADMTNESSHIVEATSESTKSEEPVSSVQQSLMSWASRFSATSVQLATERAQQAIEVASERRKAAAWAMAGSIPSTLLRPSAVEAVQTSPSLDVDIFIQTSSGAFLPLPKEKQKQSSELRVTNSSLLTVRKSAAKACSPQSYSFQWYRSFERLGANCDQTEDWVELEGATSRTFQPTATEVGHKIRCLVTKLETYDSDEEDEDPEDSIEKPSSASLETFECVSAALALFNGARQALVNGAQFGSIKGEGNAAGRNFRIKISMLISKDPKTKKPCSQSSVCFYQVAGSTSEPMNSEEEPIVGVTAVANNENAKCFDLILPDNLPESASMVKALANDDGRLKLSAPNRLSRESLLLSIGIANYNGEPSSLGPSSVLFYDAVGDAGEVQQSTTTLNCEAVESLENIMEKSLPAESLERPPLIPKNGESMQRSISLDDTLEANRPDSQRIKEMERELNSLRSKLAKKDKAMGDLQQQMKSCESSNSKLRQSLADKDTELRDTKKNLLKAERRMQSQEDDMKRMRSDHVLAVEKLNKDLESRIAIISEQEKTIRNLQNEKAILSATVEARDSKLAKATDATDKLQASLNDMKSQVAKTDSLRTELAEMSQKYEDICDQNRKLEVEEKACRQELEAAKRKISLLEEKMINEVKSVESCRTELDAQLMKIQKLKAERNNYKQKSDSLSKEISRVCRQGRTIKDVEKIISDDAARRQEVELLREQKRKALEDLNQYRTALEQSRMAQKLAGLDHETTKVLERNAELERLLSELTEYVSAKEMQLDTLKQVNEALQLEIKELHKAQMSKNLGKNDV